MKSSERLRGRAGEGPSTARLDNRGREAELTPRVAAGGTAITHLGAPDQHLCTSAQARSARTPRPPRSHAPPLGGGGADSGDGGVSKEPSGRHVSFSPGSWEEGQPGVPHARLCAAAWRRAGPAHDLGRVNISSLADLARGKGPRQNHRGTLCEPPPPKEKFLMPFNWPAKFWDVR